MALQRLISVFALHNRTGCRGFPAIGRLCLARCVERPLLCPGPFSRTGRADRFAGPWDQKRPVGATNHGCANKHGPAWAREWGSCV